MTATAQKPASKSKKKSKNAASQTSAPEITSNPVAKRTPPMRVLRGFIREEKRLFATNLGLRLIKDLLPFQGPILVGICVDLLSGTDRSILGWQLPALDTTSILIVAAAMAVLAVIKAIINFLNTMSSAYLGRAIVETSRHQLAEAVMQMTLDERRNFNSGDLMERCINDSKSLRNFTQNVIIRLVSNTLRAVYPIIIMFSIDAIMAVVVLAVIPLQSLFSAVYQRRLHILSRETRRRSAEHTSAVKEAIDGWGSLVSVSGEDWVAREMSDTARAAENARIKKKRTTASMSVVISLCTAMGIAACYAIGGLRIVDAGISFGDNAVAGALTIGTLTTFVGVAKKTYAPFEAYSSIAGSYRNGLVNLERIAEVLDAPMQDPRPNGPVLNVTAGSIELEDVAFGYSEDAALTLDGLSGVIPGRSMTVITGSSGAGKTTLLRLLMGLDIPQRGRVCIDGQDINVARLASLRQAVALVPQEPMLFTGTLGENLMFGSPDASTEDLVDACHKAGLLELVRELPKGIDTEVGSGRHMLSGGQLRRMAIARALLRKPSILLLDEPTAGLDARRSEQVLDTLRSISNDTTVVMVSHRRDPLAASDHHLILGDKRWSRGVAGRDARLATTAQHQRVASPTQSPAGSTPTATHANTADQNLAATNAVSSPSQTANAASSEALAVNVAKIEAPSAASSPSAQPQGASTQRKTRKSREAARNRRQKQPSSQTQPSDPTAIHLNRFRIPSLSIDPNAISQTPSVETAESTAETSHKTHVGHMVLGLSAMGRPITINGVDRDNAVRHLLVVGGHRANAELFDGFAPRLLSQIASDKTAAVAISSISNLNPDGRWTRDGRTVLGIDISADHLRLGSVETKLLQQTAAQLGSSLLVDVARDTERTALSADVEMVLRYSSEQPASKAWMLQLASDLDRMLAASRFSITIDVEECEADSITAATGLAVVELTAIAAPSAQFRQRSIQAALEATQALCRAAGLLESSKQTSR